jgi:pimeloyl-ACP methyl ester carboxylesterase
MSNDESELPMQSTTAPERLHMGDDGRSIAILRRPGRAPGLSWLGGFRSDMEGSKAMALDQFGISHALAITRFDYSGHGRSGGDFNQGTIGRWLDEAEAVFATTTGPQIVVGSSMGGWLALLLNRRLRAAGNDRIGGLVLIAPAVDMTEDLMRRHFTTRETKAMDKQGFIEQPSEYGGTYRIGRQLIEEGAEHLLFGRVIITGCPVTILQGGKDKTVLKEHAHRLVQHIVSDPVQMTLIPDGDHRLSRPEDLLVLERAVEQMVSDLVVPKTLRA